MVDILRGAHPLFCLRGARHSAEGLFCILLITDRCRRIDSGDSTRAALHGAPEVSQPALIAGVHPVSHSGGACILERFTSMRLQRFKPYCYARVSQRVHGAGDTVFTGLIESPRREKNDR